MQKVTTPAASDEAKIMPRMNKLVEPLGTKEGWLHKRSLRGIMNRHRKSTPSEITENIALDTYDDLFSDFDYGPCRSRRVSADLLVELEGRLTGKSGARNVEIVFEIPEKLRKPEVEVMVKERLSQVFAEKYNSAEDEIRSERWSGLVRIGLGSLVLTGEALANIFAPSTATTIITGIALIGGWFGVFTGFEKLFLDLRKELVKKRDMYGLLSEAKIEFNSAKE